MFLALAVVVPFGWTCVALELAVVVLLGLTCVELGITLDFLVPVLTVLTNELENLPFVETNTFVAFVAFVVFIIGLIAEKRTF